MNRNNIYYLLVILLVAPTLLFAQNNRMNMDDDLYAYYVKCNESIRNPIVVNMCDTLFKKAEVSKDERTQCLALLLKTNHYHYSKNTDKLKESVSEMKEFVVNTPYTQYYFSALNRGVLSAMQSELYLEALELIDHYHEEAVLLNNLYGIATAYMQYGNLYTILRNQELAFQNFKQACLYFEESTNSTEASKAYSYVGNYYINKKEYEEAISYIQKSLDYATDENSQLLSLLSFVDIYCELNDEISASYYFSQFNAIYDKATDKESIRYNYLTTKLKYCLLIKEYEEAINLTELFSGFTKANFKYIIHKDLGDFRGALSWHEKMDSINIETNNTNLAALLTESFSRFEKSKLENEKKQLALENSEMRVRDLEHERVILESEQERIHLSQQANLLRIRNLSLENQQRLSDIEMAKSEAARLEEQTIAAEKLATASKDLAHASEERARASEEREKAIGEREKLQVRIFLISVCALLVILILFVINYFIRKKHMIILKNQRNLALVAQEEAESARAQADLSNRQKTVFLQNLSHEIRTPLNAIIGFNDVLNSEDDDDKLTPEERREYLDYINKNNELLTTLVNDVLDITSIEDNKYAINIEKVDVNDICNAVMKNIAQYVPKGVETKLVVPSISKRFYSDSARLQQVLTNYLTNACKFTHKGSITLGYKAMSNGDIEFYVEDTGMGIPADKAEHIFSRFSKLDTFTQGTGLGLSICKRIAELLTGKVYLDTNYKNGARFVFVHPLLRKD